MTENESKGNAIAKVNLLELEAIKGEKLRLCSQSERTKKQYQTTLKYHCI